MNRFTVNFTLQFMRRWPWERPGSGEFGRTGTRGAARQRDGEFFLVALRLEDQAEIQNSWLNACGCGADSLLSVRDNDHHILSCFPIFPLHQS